ncbi:stalk domain-containing protein [Ammoniphilus resinae]|uniref:Copper amine oxidase-like N-terminal domain-containing protein n=1 Tax=Ammoniphilus resinae TaxID=861532 RepID=A0ABS4GMZ8_9BACL|nr:stalk domain-containing protein [Ammoniphilus resinae]MBP1931633.1 hypothetical protein [Ammoniphilus resinae]
MRMKWVLLLSLFSIVFSSQTSALESPEPHTAYLDINSNRTFVPLRFVSESLGAEVIWQAETRQAIVKSKDLTIQIPIGSRTAWVNENPFTLDANAFIQDQRTYIPLRFVSEGIGATVSWNVSEKRVTVSRDQIHVDLETVIRNEAEVFENERFRLVKVEKNADTYTVSGEAQIFEAVFGYVVEDGHNELVKGHASTEKGAPEWGAFSFKFNVKKQDENTSLTLILFEESLKDGGREYELFIPLD